MNCSYALMISSFLNQRCKTTVCPHQVKRKRTECCFPTPVHEILAFLRVANPCEPLGERSALERSWCCGLERSRREHQADETRMKEAPLRK